MQNHYTPKGKHLTMDNRRLIERWKNENTAYSKIVKQIFLNKARSLTHYRTFTKESLL